MSASGKKRGLLAVFVVLVLLVIGGVFAWRFFRDAGSGPERALPRVEGQSQILVKMENPKFYKDKLLAAVRLMGGISRLPALPLPDELRGVFGNVAGNLVGDLAGLLDVAEQAAFLAVRGETGGAARFYLSFVPDERAFGELIESAGNLFASIEAWDGVEGREGWIARPALPLAELFGELPALYLLRSGRGADSPVLVSGSPEAIGEMRRALSSSTSRVRVTRQNPAPDYIQVQHPVGTPSDETRTATAEIAWTMDETSAHAQFYTDTFSLMTGRSVPKSGLRGEDLPLLGNGDLAFVAALDIPYACFAAFPTSDDPIGEVLRTLGALLPVPQYREDLRAVMAEGRISVVVVDDGDERKADPNTAYLVLESKARGAMSRLSMIPKLLMKSAELPGWDSCHTMGLWRDFNLVLAQRGDMLLLGAGELSEYEREASIPGGIEDFAAPRDLADLVATPSFWRIARPHLREHMSSYDMASFMNNPAFESCTIHLRVITPEQADIGFYWGEGKK